MCVCACIRACLRACVHSCVRACLRACKHACLRACVRACVRAYVRACACVRVIASQVADDYNSDAVRQCNSSAPYQLLYQISEHHYINCGSILNSIVLFPE